MLWGDKWFRALLGAVRTVLTRLERCRPRRSRFPDGNPEQTGEWLFGANAAMGGGDYIQAFIRDQYTTWTPAKPKAPAEEIVVTAKDWPGVEWPMTEEGGETTWTGEGDFGEFYMGVGGTCDDVTPSAGYRRAQP